MEIYQIGDKYTIMAVVAGDEQQARDLATARMKERKIGWGYGEIHIHRLGYAELGIAAGVVCDRTAGIMTHEVS